MWTDQNNEQFAQACLSIGTQVYTLNEAFKRLLLKYGANVAGDEAAELRDAAAMDKAAMEGIVQLATKYVTFLEKGEPLDEPNARMIIGRALKNGGL